MKTALWILVIVALAVAIGSGWAFEAWAGIAAMLLGVVAALAGIAIAVVAVVVAVPLALVIAAVAIGVALLATVLGLAAALLPVLLPIALLVAIGWAIGRTGRKPAAPPLPALPSPNGA